MAKGKVEYWLTSDGLTLLGGWAREGLTDEQIADKCKINVATLYRWKNKHCEICEALKKNKDIVDYEVENALLDQARKGNITAIIYWLNNRRPDQWRNKQDKNNNDSLTKLDKLLEEQKNA